MEQYSLFEWNVLVLFTPLLMLSVPYNWVQNSKVSSVTLRVVSCCLSVQTEGETKPEYSHVTSLFINSCHLTCGVFSNMAARFRDLVGALLVLLSGVSCFPLGQEAEQRRTCGYEVSCVHVPVIGSSSSSSFNIADASLLKLKTVVFPLLVSLLFHSFAVIL